MRQNWTLRDNLRKKDWSDSSLKGDLKIWRDLLIKTKENENLKEMNMFLKLKFKINTSRLD